MTSKLFGQESQEQRESRLAALEQSIQEGEETVKEKNTECQEFVRTAWEDIERFKEQKDKDLREALISYAIMQISMCKKGVQVWSNAKECFNKMWATFQPIPILQQNSSQSDCSQRGHQPVVSSLVEMDSGSPNTAFTLFAVEL